MYLVKHFTQHASGWAIFSVVLNTLGIKTQEAPHAVQEAPTSCRI